MNSEILTNTVDSTAEFSVQEVTQIPEVPPVDILPIVQALELGFSGLILSVGMVAGFMLSKILNWWKW
ncbi:MAG: hypothetical protein RSB38_08180 [Oscillospiraceae bacterium]